MLGGTRLGRQILLSEALSGLVVKLPTAECNMMADPQARALTATAQHDNIARYRMQVVEIVVSYTL